MFKIKIGTHIQGTTRRCANKKQKIRFSREKWVLQKRNKREGYNEKNND